MKVLEQDAPGYVFDKNMIYLNKNYCYGKGHVFDDKQLAL